MLFLYAYLLPPNYNLCYSYIPFSFYSKFKRDFLYADNNILSVYNKSVKRQDKNYTRGGVGNIDYSKFNISRKQAQQIAFAIVADIEAYVEKHSSEYEAFLAKEQEEGDYIYNLNLSATERQKTKN